MSARAPRRHSEGLIDLSSSQKCHVVGIGGPGMSPLALLLKGLGHFVSGSDMKASAVTQQLTNAGVTVTIGHDAALIHGADVVVYSTAIPNNNVELVAARNEGIAVRHRSDLLASLCRSLESVGVAGTHGKTTTSALLTHILVTVGKDPSCIIGAEVPGMGIGARAGSSSLFVLESDESDGTLDVLPLSHLIVTNVDVDHLDYFGTFEEVQQCFVDAVERTTGHVVLNVDDNGSLPAMSAVLRRGNFTTFGKSLIADVIVRKVEPTESGIRVELNVRDVRQTLLLPLRGEHNALNAAAAIAMALHLGVSLVDACAAVESFAGVGRRFTERGVFNGAVLVDDYAHLPAEIHAALLAARSHPSLTGQLVAVFQPNRFHRIAAMADTYADCFEAADVVVITDVYASGTAFIEGVTGELVVNYVKEAHPDARVVWAPQRKDIVDFVGSFLTPGDVCISMGCGDIETFPDDLLETTS